MGILDGIMGNASEVNLAEVHQVFRQILVPSEVTEKAYKLVRDIIVLTNKRIILMDKQGVTGKKIEFHSIPYNHVTHFSIETAGTLDLDLELKLWIASSQEALVKKFNKNTDIYELQGVLAKYVLK
jgi:hypothetical protein